MVPREAVDSLSLEIFKTHLDAVLCSLLWVTLLGQGVGLGDPQRSLPTPRPRWDSAADAISSVGAPFPFALTPPRSAHLSRLTPGAFQCPATSFNLGA